MPASTRLEVGYPAMSCTFTLSGLVDLTDESKTAGWLFGPYQATSPLYRKDALYAPVTVDVGLNTDAAAGSATQGTPEYVRKFTGKVDATSSTTTAPSRSPASRRCGSCCAERPSCRRC
jgi:hypothetical protein